MENPKDFVVVYRENQVVSKTPLVDGMTIGRGASATLQFEDLGLSRVHALVQSAGDRWFLVDKSMNGTWLDGRRLERDQPAAIDAGAVAVLADYQFQFQLAPRASAMATRVAQAPAPVAAPVEPPPSSSPLLEHLIDRRRDIPVWKEGPVQLRVADIVEETHDTRTFRLVGLDPILFSFKPGQFVTLKLRIDGKDVARSYSISSSPSRPHCLELTIKRVPGGLVSNWMCDNVKLGDVIDARGPAGKFSCFNYPSKKILFIGGGSGITPVMSMLRWIVDTAADVDCYLFVSARSPRDIIFRNELNSMSARHSAIRVGVTCTSRCTGADAWTGLTGRCDVNMLRMLVPDIHERHVFMCGPDPFMASVTECLRAIEFPIKNLHTESFGKVRVAPGVEVKPRDVPRPVSVSVRIPPLAQPQAPAPPPVATPAAAPEVTKGFEVTFSKAGKKVVTAGECSLLELAEGNELEINHQCRVGTCGECKVLCTRGTVAMEDHCCISDDERAGGYVYTCCARPTSDVVLEA